MNLLQFPKALLSKKFTAVSVLGTVGGLISRRFFVRKRNRWEKLTPDRLETVLDTITTYDMARGAGKLLEGWLRFNQPKLTVDGAETRLKQMLAEMDRKDESSYDRARSRLLVSKALFYVEGFQWKSCRYEKYQREALLLLKQIPVWASITREQIFQAQPFTPEELIGATHRMLLLLEHDKLADYITRLLEQKHLKTELDYMVRLVALTFGIQESGLFEEIMLQWLTDYRDFKLKQAKQQEHWVNTSLSVLSGEVPAQLGMNFLSKILKRGKNPAGQ